MEGLKYIPYVTITLLVAGIILGASVITNSTFGDTMTKCFNSSYTINAFDNGCANNTLLSAANQGPGGRNLSTTFYGIAQSQAGLQTTGQQFSTIGIIAVMIIIITLIAGIFTYMRFFA